LSKLQKLVGEGKEIKIGEINLDIKPLTVSSLPLLMQIGDETNKEAQANAMKEVLTRTLKDSVPDATDKEIDKISIEHMTKLMEAIMEVNQLEMDSEKKEFFKKLREQNVGHDAKDGAQARER